MREAKGANALWPEALESFCILTPCLNEDIESGTAFEFGCFEEGQDVVGLIVDQEDNGDYETLKELI